MMAKKKSKAVEPAPEMNYDLLRKMISDAARKAFARLRTQCAKEHRYSFALVSDHDARTVVPAANTIEVFQRRKTDYEDIIAILRCSVTEWEYGDSVSDVFESISAMLNADDVYPEGGFVRHKGRVYATMLLALLDVEREGVFGAGVEREKLTLTCQVVNCDTSVWLEDESAKRLNSSKLYKAFRKQWKTYRADDLELLGDEMDDIYHEFLPFLEAGTKS
jgi:hypothetical protein